jgi:aspartyl-tRNA(Asn)/glutamyl-tRNA(Gln) amidotransferase subunit C
MLEYFSVMEKIDVTGLEATVQTLGRENITRTDIVSTTDVTGKMLDNAPQTEDRFIIIPKVL